MKVKKTYTETKDVQISFPAFFLVEEIYSQKYVMYSGPEKGVTVSLYGNTRSATVCTHNSFGSNDLERVVSNGTPISEKDFTHAFETALSCVNAALLVETATPEPVQN